MDEDMYAEQDREEASLDDYLDKLRNEVLSKEYSFWIRQQYPITYEDVFEGRETQVDINALETTGEYVLLTITASNSPWGWSVTKGTSVIIRKV